MKNERKRRLKSLQNNRGCARKQHSGIRLIIFCPSHFTSISSVCFMFTFFLLAVTSLTLHIHSANNKSHYMHNIRRTGTSVILNEPVRTSVCIRKKRCIVKVTAHRVKNGFWLRLHHCVHARTLICRAGRGKERTSVARIKLVVLQIPFHTQPVKYSSEVTGLKLQTMTLHLHF